MAENINLNADEYNQLLTQLEALHTQILDDTESYLKRISNLCVDGEGYSSDLLKPKTDALIETIRTEIITSMQSVFLAGEDCTRTFTDTISSLDIVRGVS